MQSSTHKLKTAMAAFVGADINKIKDISKRSKSENSICDIANYNTANQIVLSGDEVAIDKAINLADNMSIKAFRLDVSAPFHSIYMKETASALENEFKRYSFSFPKTQIISNIEAKPFSDKKNIIDSLVKQTYSTVRWYESIKYMSKMDVNTFYEIGFGNILSGLIRRIDRSNIVKGIIDPVHIENLAKEII